ncbi:Structural maintenance of chromosomes flexible hinge domain-containing protein GMI1 [Glycine max]|nr:Structural maintenance of chromosomes flexible hinge domain-containing protein GMI1 [Glycine max]
MEGLNSRKRRLVLSDDDDSEKVFTFKILLPNGTSVELTLRDPEAEMPLGNFVRLVKEKYSEARKHCESMKNTRDINWKGGSISLQDANDKKIRNVLNLKNYKPNKYHILRLHRVFFLNQDGSSEVAQSFENMWDSTPDTDLLLELPEEYTFETALADLIDNSLQAVWSNGEDKRKLIRVNLGKSKISIFDNGPGLDDTDENSLVKGKMDASLHRSSKSKAIGGKPPYLMPYFGMFGYGGPIASMHLGRRASVSYKTKHVKKVYTLHLEREALLNTSSSQLTWKTGGGIRDPLANEIRDSHGSFTKTPVPSERPIFPLHTGDKKSDEWLEIGSFPTSSHDGLTHLIIGHKLNGQNYTQCVRSVKIFLRGKGKEDYISGDSECPKKGDTNCDDTSDRGKTITPIEFKVNDVDLTEIQGGEVAITNWHSCNGPEFVFQLHLKSESSRELQANARMRFVYLPFTKGKENIERVLEKLKSDGFVISEDFQSFSRVSVRRLGRLLPDARWEQKGNQGSNIEEMFPAETDGGFKPTLSKTDLAHHNPFTAALKNFGNKFSEKEKDVTVEIRKATKVLTLLKLQMEYQDWILQMHHQYDEEADSGEDQPVIIVGPANEKALGISSDVIRVHQVLNRKEKSWKRGQKIKVLKGACAGCHRTTIYATIEYFLLEGFEGDAGGEARIICRAIDIPDENGSFLSVGDEDASLEIRGSLSLPISVIDSGKVIAVESIEWENRLTKKQQKSTSIYLPGANHYENLETNGVVSVESIEWENRLYKKQQKSPSINLSGANHYEHLEADGVPVIKMPIVKYAGQPPCTDKGIIDLQEPSLYHENSLIEFFLNYDKELFDSICKLAERIQKVESHLNNSNEKKAETEQEMVKLLEKVEPYQLSIMDSSFTKDELMTKIRSMENSPYSVLCSLSKREKPPNYFLEDLIGVVALIGTVQRPELSRILAEYLGEAKMLGLIYRSFDTASSLEKYNQKGEIDYERALHAEAAALGKAISNRFHVICFEDIRPYTGWLHDDSQRRLALPNPRIANGETPEGFIGYAVNMVDLDINSLQIMTASDFGLRETVYNTRENMVAARTCIEDGAVSLDGGILSENGILSLGYGNPSICFPCENQKVLPREIEKILPQMEGKKSDLRMIEERIKGLEHSRAKYIKKFNKKKERYDKVTDRMKPMTELLKYKPEAGDGSNSSECSVQYRAVDPNSQNVLSITWIGSPSHPCMVKLNGIRCITIRPENLNLSGIIGADSIFRLQKLKSGELGLEQH